MTTTKVVFGVIAAVLLIAVLGFTLNSLGIIGTTVVEREVFEASYQRQAGLKDAIAQDKAVIEEIERKLLSRELDENTRRALEAQAAAARIRIRTNQAKLAR